jgi:hypothetical protein
MTDKDIKELMICGIQALRIHAHYHNMIQTLVAENMVAEEMEEDIPNGVDEFKQNSRDFHNKFEALIKHVDMKPLPPVEKSEESENE